MATVDSASGFGEIQGAGSTGDIAAALARMWAASDSWRSLNRTMTGRYGTDCSPRKQSQAIVGELVGQVMMGSNDVESGRHRLSAADIVGCDESVSELRRHLSSADRIAIVFGQVEQLVGIHCKVEKLLMSVATPWQAATP